MVVVVVVAVIKGAEWREVGGGCRVGWEVLLQNGSGPR